MNDLTDKLADALERVLKTRLLFDIASTDYDVLPSKETADRVDEASLRVSDADEFAEEALALHRAQRDGEREAVRCECYIVTGRHEWVVSWTGATKRCRQCRRFYRRPLAKGEG